MKRVLAFALVICMCLGMAGCKDSGAAERQEHKKVIKAQQELANAAMPEKMPAFSTTSLDGKTVTEDIFGQAEITVINFWGTFCTPCIDEMPELGEWADEMPDNVQILGVVADVQSAGGEGVETARMIVEKTGADYEHVIIGDQFKEIYELLVGVPTTFFVNCEGEILGDPIVGANVQGYKDRVEELLNEVE